MQIEQALCIALNLHYLCTIVPYRAKSKMGKIDHIAAMLASTGQTLGGMMKILLMSRRSTVKPTAKSGEEIVVLGNGPSLNDTIAHHADFLACRRKIAVNFAANTPVFRELRPDYYVLADPHFFSDSDPNVDKLWNAFNAIDWPMTLFVPATTRTNSRIRNIKAANSMVAVAYYNMTPIEGFKWFRHAVYRAGLGMPRPRNVLIPSLMLAIASGFKSIYVAGADHSWMQTLSVDDENRVISIQPHFYKEAETERKRIDTEYMRYPLHQIVYSFYVAFKAYHTIREYADSVQARIWNITPKSFIDAFPRKKL